MCQKERRLRIWERAGRLLFQEAVIVVMCAVIGVAALTVAYLIPRDEIGRAHV